MENFHNNPALVEFLIKKTIHLLNHQFKKNLKLMTSTFTISSKDTKILLFLKMSLKRLLPLQKQNTNRCAAWILFCIPKKERYSN